MLAELIDDNLPEYCKMNQDSVKSKLKCTVLQIKNISGKETSCNNFFLMYPPLQTSLLAANYIENTSETKHSIIRSHPVLAHLPSKTASTIFQTKYV